MPTTNLTSAGLPNTLNWAPTVTKLPGSTRLVYGQSRQPEGVLLKVVPSLEDALDAGGIFLRNAAGKWMFAIGDTLRDIIAAGKLGQFSTNVDNIYQTEIEKRLAQTVEWSTIRSPSTEYWSDTYAGVYAKGSTGYRSFFDAGDVLEVLAVVTSANRGLGYSVGSAIRPPNVSTPVGTDAFSFMATDTPMSSTMTQFLMSTKSATLAGIQSDFRGYYAAVFDAVAANRTTKPKLAAVTAWRNGLLCGTPVLEEKGVFRSRDEVYNALVPTGITAATYYSSNPVPILRIGGDSTHAPGGAYTPVQITSGSHTGTNGPAAIDIQLMVQPRLGFYLPGTPAMPCLMTQYGDVYTFAPEPAGDIGRYQVGRLRDAQLLGRSLVDGQLFGTQVANYTDIARYVNATFSTLRGREALTPDAATSLEDAERYAVTNRSALNGLSYNVFSAGELPLAADKFLADLNQAAKNYAQR